MIYTILTHGSEQHLEISINEYAADGWVLMGPVVAGRADAGEYIATMWKSEVIEVFSNELD